MTKDQCLETIRKCYEIAYSVRRQLDDYFHYHQVAADEVMYARTSEDFDFIAQQTAKTLREILSSFEALDDTDA